MADFAKVSLILRRLVATLALAILLASVTACFDQEAAGVLFLPTWAALFFGWPYLSRKLNFNINILKSATPASEAVGGVGTGHRHRLGRVWDRAASGHGFFCCGGAADLDCPVLRMACIEPSTAAAERGR